MDDIPRELFVSALDREYAYRDTALGIDCGQTISQPFVVAYMTEQLQVRPEHRVLEIGTGSGYQAAVLSRLGREIVTIERFRTLADHARQLLAKLDCSNVDVVLGDGLDVPETLGTFDRIMVTAAMEEVPQALLSRLEPDGALIAPVGPLESSQTLTRFQKTAEGYASQELVAVRFVPTLPGIAREL
jgi:protein-L-isoaspartate(D-aspartate) O-methyltransferase